MQNFLGQFKDIRFLRVRPWIVLGLVMLLTDCAAAAPPSRLSQVHPESKIVIFVTSNGWHSGVIVAKADLPPDRLPEITDFPEARYIEFGWGDAVFYPSKEMTISNTLSAALVPTSAVVHVVGLRAEPARVFTEAEIIALPIDDKNFGRLINFIDASFERSGAQRALSSGPGLYATSRFYPAKGSFHLFNTCNTWTARALAAAKFDIDAAGTLRAEALMQQVRTLVRP